MDDSAASPKGKLLIIGGAEHKGGDAYLDMENKNIKFKKYEILRELLKASREKKIAIVTTASRVPHEVRRSYEHAFRKVDAPTPEFISIGDRRECKDKIFLSRAENADAVFFSGGDQVRIGNILNGTRLIEIIKDRYIKDRNFILAGTSAGAMALCRIMIVGGRREEALIGSHLKIASGLGILDKYIIDTHFIKRSRFGRLAHAIIAHPKLLGIGLGEDTALIIKNGYDAFCSGSGMVTIIDGKGIKNTNISYVKKGEPIYVENLRIHLLVKGCRFSLKSRKFIGKSGSK